MRLLYDIAFLIFAFFYVPIAAIKGKLRRGIFEKFGKVPPDVCRAKKPVWLHAVSVGEALVAARICERIKNVSPKTPVVVSTTTATGREMLKRSSVSADAVFYYPFDLSFVASRAVEKIDPSVFVVIETELWPNMLSATARRGVPVIMANGRISDGSFRNYSIIRPLTRNMLRCFRSVCVQTRQDAERIERLGCPGTRVVLTGNIKFDTSPHYGDFPGREAVEKRFCAGKQIIVGGSTHFPEETLLIDAFTDIKKRSPMTGMILAPRHIERKDAVRIYAERSGLRSCFFSDVVLSEKCLEENTDVMIVDTIGSLKDIYRSADVVFIGGSVAKKGGQNPIEAANWGKAVVFGPHMYNFRQVAKTFLDAGAAMMIKDARELASAIEGLLRDADRRKQMEQKCSDVIRSNSGAVKKTVDIILRHLNDARAGTE